MPQTLGAALAYPAAIVLLLLPGLGFLSVLGASDRERLRLDERLFLTGAISVAASSWIALLLAEFGAFGTVRAAAIEIILFLIVLLIARFLGRRPGWPFAWPDRAVTLLPALFVALIAFLLLARPSE